MYPNLEQGHTKVSSIEHIYLVLSRVVSTYDKSVGSSSKANFMPFHKAMTAMEAIQRGPCADGWDGLCLDSFSSAAVCSEALTHHENFIATQVGAVKQPIVDYLVEATMIYQGGLNGASWKDPKTVDSRDWKKALKVANEKGGLLLGPGSKRANIKYDLEEANVHAMYLFLCHLHMLMSVSVESRWL